jgi:hypothetical protein
MNIMLVCNQYSKCSRFALHFFVVFTAVCPIIVAVFSDDFGTLCYSDRWTVKVKRQSCKAWGY